MKKGLLSFLLFVFTGINLLAQCFPDRHNTSWYDGWISCEKSSNPNASRGKSHWILYDLNYSYLLGKMHFWNSNAPDYLTDGIKTAAIDVSMDGVNWDEIGQFDIEMAQGKSSYEGVEGPDLGGIEARYVLITGISNWGGFCYGLGEVKIEVMGITGLPKLNTYSNHCIQTRLFPNPANTATRLDVLTTCSLEPITYEIRDLSGRTILHATKTPVEDFTGLELNIADLVQGSYLLVVSQNGIIAQEKLIKI